MQLVALLQMAKVHAQIWHFRKLARMWMNQSFILVPLILVFKVILGSFGVPVSL